MGDLLSNILDNALDAALQLRQNGFRRTFVVHQIPAEHGARQCRRGLGRFMNRNNLVVPQFFGTIFIMTVLIMQPVAPWLSDLQMNTTRVKEKESPIWKVHSSTGAIPVFARKLIDGMQLQNSED